LVGGLLLAFSIGGVAFTRLFAAGVSIGILNRTASFAAASLFRSLILLAFAFLWFIRGIRIAIALFLVLARLRFWIVRGLLFGVQTFLFVFTSLTGVLHLVVGIGLSGIGWLRRLGTARSSFRLFVRIALQIGVVRTSWLGTGFTVGCGLARFAAVGFLL